MKWRLIIGLILAVWSHASSARQNPGTNPESGVLDLRQMTLDQSSLISLKGEWEFYWNQLLTPETYTTNTGTNGGMVVHVPSYWSSYSLDGKSLPGMGYGTYALTVLLPGERNSTICFEIPVFDVAYRLFMNERDMGGNGTVGTSRDTEKPWYEPTSFCYLPDNDTLRILIQVSNFHHRRGGFWKVIFMGGSERILGRVNKWKMVNYSSIGILLYFTFFFMLFWLISRKEINMLFFALTALGILMRSANTGTYLSNMFIYTPWNWQIRMEYLGSYVALVFGMQFLHQIFPARYMAPVIRGNTILFAAASVSLFMLPVHLFSYEMMVFQPVILILLMHYLVRSFLGTLKGRPMDTIFLISMALFIYALVNDILLANTAGAISNIYLSQITFQVFIFAMSAMIIRQWVINYNERVNLESSLRFKNKILSVVAHDLKNPVASVAQFSELLARKPGLSSEDRFINSLQESSQAAVALLDNLLYWGRSQAHELQVKPGHFKVTELVDEVRSLYAHSAMQKEINFTTKILTEAEVYADRNLVNIVIRNLVSNAIKFTPRNGTVRLNAEEAREMIRFSVVDTGVGIEEDVIKQFELNGKLASSEGTDKELGTGLGLQLVKDLVKRNGGVLTIESKTREGSTFSFTLPKHK